MNFSYTVYSVAIAWFTYTAFRMSVLLYQFLTFPKTYGSMPKFSLYELLQSANEVGKDLPTFNVVVPAYNETEVIEGTIHRLVSMNYPLTHFRIYVTTYDDEQTPEGFESTSEVVSRVAAELNQQLNIPLVRHVQVPAGYDGNFPGSLDSEISYIGKSRGLNYTLRSIHQLNERDERQFYIGKMIERGFYKNADHIIKHTKQLAANKKQQAEWIRDHFMPDANNYIGVLTLSSQLDELVEITNALLLQNNTNEQALESLVDYIQKEAERFYLQIELVEEVGDRSITRLEAWEISGKEFLFEVLQQVENELAFDAGQAIEIQEKSINSLLQQIHDKHALLESTMPFLFAEIQSATDGDALYQASKKLNSRWMMAFDADADAPADLMRYLAARILDEPSLMGFQGPVAPILNYEEVHPLCRLGGLWMAFWHAAKYPRIMNKPEWAHPLAGTNWCFQIEGMEHQGTLIRDCRYQESRRRFLLSFDPQQLTEDLEAGVRLYSEWAINAEWHPVLEMEQVPPTPKALIVQRTRWTLGTLQTIGYIVRSKIPLLQKIRYVFHPSEIIINGSGPVIAIFLFVALFGGLIVVEPVFAWWAVVLTFANLIYVICFHKIFERYYDLRQRQLTMDYIYQHRRQLVSSLGELSATQCHLEEGLIHKLINLLEQAKAQNGFAQRYFSSRCLDDDESNQNNTTMKIDQTYQQLLKYSSARIHSSDLDELLSSLQAIQARQSSQAGTAVDSKLSKKLHVSLSELKDCMQKQQTLESGSQFYRWSKFHKEILIWTFPYIFYQLGPYFKGLYKWLRREKSSWHKTDRTPKKKHGKTS